MSANKDGIPQPTMYSSKKFLDGYEEIDWREKSIYCERCGLTFKKPGKHHWSDRLKMYVCNPGQDCNFN